MSRYRHGVANIDIVSISNLPGIHVGHAVAQILRLIKRTFVYKDYDLVKRLFTSLVRPRLKYAIVFHLSSTIKKRTWNSIQR